MHKRSTLLAVLVSFHTSILCFAAQSIQDNPIHEEELRSDLENFPRPSPVKLTFNPKNFLNDCYNSREIPKSVLPIYEGSTQELCWKALFALKDHYKANDDTDKYIHTYHVMTKYLLSHNVFPEQCDTNAKQQIFKSQLIDKIGLGILPTVQNNKLKKWSYIYSSMLLRDWANRYSSNKMKRLGDAYHQINEAIKTHTTRTAYLLAVELMLDENYTPQEMTRQEALGLALEYIEVAVEKQNKPKPIGFESPPALQPKPQEDMIIKHARPPYIRLVLKLNGKIVVPNKIGGTPHSLEEEASTGNANHALPVQIEIDTLTDFDFSHFVINQRDDDLPIRNETFNKRGGLQESYPIDTEEGLKHVSRQNVSGKGMRCFYNAAGLNPDVQIRLLKSLDQNPIVRFMIANEIVSAIANPHQIPDSVKQAIHYEDYVQERIRLDLLAVQRNRLLVQQSPVDTLQDITLLDPIYQNLDAAYEINRENLRKHALSLETFHAFIDDHIGNEEMMVALLDVIDNGIYNYTSIDAIAYGNNIGLKIFQLRNKRLMLVHQYIPENATEIKYILHEGLHFQALNERNDPLINEMEVEINHSESSKAVVFPSRQELKERYPGVVTLANKMEYEPIVVRKVLYLNDDEELKHKEIATHIGLDPRRISEILLANDKRTVTLFSVDVKDRILNTIIKNYKDIQVKKIRKIDLAKEIVKALNEQNDTQELTCDIVSNYISNKISRGSIQKLSVINENLILQLYRKNHSIVQIIEKFTQINVKTLLYILGTNLDQNEVRGNISIQVTKEPLSEREKEDLIIQSFNDLSQQNQGKSPAVLQVTNALKDHKIGYKTVKRVLKREKLIKKGSHAKFLTPELAETIRKEYKKLNPQRGQRITIKRALARKYGLTEPQINNLFLKNGKAYTAGKFVEMEKNSKLVIAEFKKLTPEQQKRPINPIFLRLEKQGHSMVYTSIRKHLEKAGLYQSNGQPVKKSMNMQVEENPPSKKRKRDSDQISNDQTRDQNPNKKVKN